MGALGEVSVFHNGRLLICLMSLSCWENMDAYFSRCRRLVDLSHCHPAILPLLDIQAIDSLSTPSHPWKAAHAAPALFPVKQTNQTDPSDGIQNENAGDTQDGRAKERETKKTHERQTSAHSREIYLKGVDQGCRSHACERQPHTHGPWS